MLPLVMPVSIERYARVQSFVNRLVGIAANESGNSFAVRGACRIRALTNLARGAIPTNAQRASGRFV